MRDILFKGKRIDDGEWLRGSLILDHSSKKAAISIYANLVRKGEDVTLKEANVIEVDPSTLGEFTGLTDKNSVKIFEGDIVKAQYRSEIIVGFVEYDQYIGAFTLCDGVYDYLFCSDVFSTECEVIGNVHDNPELLKSAGKYADNDTLMPAT